MPSTTTRLSNLNDREKRFLIGGSIIVVLLLAWLLWPTGATDHSDVDLVPADQRAAAAPSAPPPAALPAAPSPVPVPIVQAAPAPAAGAPEGLRLQGVAGGGAIFTFADGSQRYVARGRPVAPGLVLQGVALHHVVLTSGSAAYRLGFAGPAVAMAPPATAAPSPGAASAGAAPQLRVAGAGVNPMGGPAVNDAFHQQATRQYLSGLSPRRSGDRINGWVVRPGASLPALAQAGLQPGDVLLKVNGEDVVDEDHIRNLSAQIVNSYRVTFEIERNGRRMTRELQVNPGAR